MRKDVASAELKASAVSLLAPSYLILPPRPLAEGHVYLDDAI
jgi:hypothetical protein